MPRRLRRQATSQRTVRQLPERPPHPVPNATLSEFGEAIEDLRIWAGLTLQNLHDLHDNLARSTISEYQKGHKLPPWEWVYDYVSTCLTYPEPPNKPLTVKDIRTELKHWETAWAYVKNHLTPRKRHRTQRLKSATPETETTADNGDGASESRSHSHRIVTTSTVALRAARVGGLIVGTAIVVTVSVVGEEFIPGAPSPPPPWSVLVTGDVNALSSTQGIDLDSGKVLDRNTPGVDVVFSDNSSRLDAVNTHFVILPEPFRVRDRHYCSDVKGWTQAYPNVYSLTEGRNICVETDQKRVAMLTITRRARPETGTIGLRFITWDGPL